MERINGVKYMFKWGDFVSHSGETLHWKIECDDLTDEDIECIAKIIGTGVLFKKVYGIPRGGDRLAAALQKYCNPDEDATLLVDDVLTTGASMIQTREKLLEKNEGSVFGVVIFSRGTPPHWVFPLFNCNIGCRKG
jgi:hypothetical protein